MSKEGSSNEDPYMAGRQMRRAEENQEGCWRCSEPLMGSSGVGWGGVGSKRRNPHTRGECRSLIRNENVHEESFQAARVENVASVCSRQSEETRLAGTELVPNHPTTADAHAVRMRNAPFLQMPPIRTWASPAWRLFAEATRILSVAYAGYCLDATTMV